VNTGEISLGMLAVNRAVVPAAQDYAQAMIAMHTGAQERQNALVSSLGITPSTSALSARLSEDAARVRTTLESADALDFDLLYIRSQVDLHARVLLTIDEQLLPNVTEELLRADLLVTRTEVATHLAQAQTLLATLEVGDTDAGVP
jgi:putative membrane protein